MADNTTVNPGSGGDIIRTEQRTTGGPKTQVIRLDKGGDASESLVEDGNPLPVADATLATDLGAPADAAWGGSGSGAIGPVLKYIGAKVEAARALLAGTLSVSFASTPTVNLGTLNGAATSAKQDSIITALGSPLQAGGTVSAAQSGTWTVTGTFWQATQPVSMASLPALAAGSNEIGSIANTSFGVSSVPQASKRVEVVPTVTAGTYGANKVVGGIMTFSSILPASPYSALLENISLKFKGSVQTQTMYVAIFSASPAGTFTDTNTAAIAAADSTLLLGLFTLSSPSSVLGTHTIYELNAIGKAIQGASQNLYAVVVAGGSLTTLASTSDMSLSIGVVQG
jgi:hypothetical protein